jgi:AcrR family transcriptional regulator
VKPAARANPAREVRTRRSPQELERLILEAARDLFAAQGYAGTTTREVAARAGVHEPLLYRRYGSKAGLYRAAVMVPFNDVISSYLRTWQGQISSPVPLRDLVVEFVHPLYALLREHNELAMALVQGREVLAEGAEPDDGEEWPSELGRILQQLVPQLEIEGDRRALQVDPSTTNIVVLGMVLGLALLDPVLPTSAVHTTPVKVRDAMVELILHGVSPPTDGAATPIPDDASTSARMLLELHDRVVAAERRAAQAEYALAQCAERLTLAPRLPATPQGA